MSTWLAHFLYERDVPSYHDKSQEWGSFDDMTKLLCNPEQECGVVDTALILHWENVKEHAPNVKTVAVLRDQDEVFSELETMGMYVPEHKQNMFLKAFVEYDGPKISFQRLKTEEGMRELCSYIEVPFDRTKYYEFKDSQIQPFLKPMEERHKQNMDTCKVFYKEYM